MEGTNKLCKSDSSIPSDEPRDFVPRRSEGQLPEVDFGPMHVFVVWLFCEGMQELDGSGVEAQQGNEHGASEVRVGGGGEVDQRSSNCLRSKLVGSLSLLCCGHLCRFVAGKRGPVVGLGGFE